MQLRVCVSTLHIVSTLTMLAVASCTCQSGSGPAAVLLNIEQALVADGSVARHSRRLPSGFLVRLQGNLAACFWSYPYQTV